MFLSKLLYMFLQLLPVREGRILELEKYDLNCHIQDCVRLKGNLVSLSATSEAFL